MPDDNEKTVKRTVREQKFIDAYIKNNGNATKAYLVIEPETKRRNAREYGYRMLQKVDISVEEILNKIGLSDPAMVKILKDGLSATRESGRGKNKKEILDHTIISKYIDMVFKLKASYPADRAKLELTGPGGQPFGEVIVLHEEVIKMCPLRLTCPIQKEVKEAERLECIKNAKNQEKGEPGEAKSG